MCIKQKQQNIRHRNNGHLRQEARAQEVLSGLERRRTDYQSDKTIDYNPSTKITHVGKNRKFNDIFQTFAFISHF